MVCNRFMPNIFWNFGTFSSTKNKWRNRYVDVYEAIIIFHTKYRKGLTNTRLQNRESVFGQIFNISIIKNHLNSMREVANTTLGLFKYAPCFCSSNWHQMYNEMKYAERLFQLLYCIFNAKCHSVLHITYLSISLYYCLCLIDLLTVMLIWTRFGKNSLKIVFLFILISLIFIKNNYVADIWRRNFILSFQAIATLKKWVC